MASNGSNLGGMASILTGIGGRIRDFFSDRDSTIHERTDKPKPIDIERSYPFSEPIEKRVKWLIDRYYYEGSFEKIQFARKWMRNILIYQGYHELEWSDVNVAWDVIYQDSADFAFPNNYYRSLILHGVRAYIQNEPLIEPTPASDDADAQAGAKAAKTALEIIRKEVKYDYLRVLEAINLRLMGNSFRYVYFSKDPRYGQVTSPVFDDVDIVLSHGGSICIQCGPMEGNFDVCPICGSSIQQKIPPIATKAPRQIGTVTYPRGEIMTEVVNPLEVYVRNSSSDLWHAPFVVRNRVVDRLALQSAFQKVSLQGSGDYGGGDAYATSGDLSLIYLQSLADLPGDPTQYASWYERASSAAKCLFVEAWLRPTQYFFDKELKKKFPDGLYGGKTGDILLEAKNDTIEDHWTHYLYTPVPGRFWGDGDDDLIPCQLKLDETDRLIQRNQGYNSVPMLAIDSQRIDKNEIINDPSTIVEVKPNGRDIREAYGEIKTQPLSQETWQWRSSHLGDMQFHSRVSPSAVGMHQPGVNSFGGQESMAAKSDASLLPQLSLWKTGDELWARQALKLAAENWLDERVMATEGMNGKWEFDKLKGSALSLDKINIITRVMPIDPSQQDAMSQAVASGLLNPQDPRVQRKAMQLFHLPTELDSNYIHQKAQWREIEKMKQTGQQIQPTLLMENDMVHIDICQQYWNTDEAQGNPQMRMLVMQHAQLHMMNMAKQAQIQAAVQGAGQQVAQHTNPQPQGQGAQPQGGKQPSGAGGGKEEKPQPHGGQVPPNPLKRQQRAIKGAAAKPNRPQPSDGNQHHVRRLT